MQENPATPCHPHAVHDLATICKSASKLYQRDSLADGEALIGHFNLVCLSNLDVDPQGALEEGRGKLLENLLLQRIDAPQIVRTGSITTYSQEDRVLPIYRPLSNGAKRMLESIHMAEGSREGHELPCQGDLNEAIRFL